MGVHQYFGFILSNKVCHWPYEHPLLPAVCCASLLKAATAHDHSDTSYFYKNISKQQLPFVSPAFCLGCLKMWRVF